MKYPEEAIPNASETSKIQYNKLIKLQSQTIYYFFQTLSHTSHIQHGVLKFFVIISFIHNFRFLHSQLKD